MKLPRFTLRGLFWLLLVISLGCAALTQVSQVWASVIFSAAVLMLVVATLRGIYSRNEVRAFYVGFAVFGWIYMLDFLVLKSHHWHPEWVTSLALQYAQPYLLPDVMVRDATGRVTEIQGTLWNQYLDIGHSVFAVLCGLAGGYLSAYFYDRESST